jgi:hypothetical protein
MDAADNDNDYSGLAKHLFTEYGSSDSEADPQRDDKLAEESEPEADSILMRAP